MTRHEEKHIFFAMFLMFAYFDPDLDGVRADRPFQSKSTTRIELSLPIGTLARAGQPRAFTFPPAASVTWCCNTANLGSEPDH